MPELISSNGGSLYYSDSGQGMPLLFLHGWLMSHNVWLYQSVLAEEFRVIAPDLRGHGMSNGTDFSYAACIDDLVALVKRLDLRKIVIVGWSMGAQLALKSWSQLRERVAGLVLVGGTPLFCREKGYAHGVPMAEARSMALLLRQNFTRTAGEFYRGMFSAEDAELVDMQTMAKSVTGGLPQPSVALAALNELIHTDLRSLLPGISSPVQLIHGDADRICLPGAAHYMLAEIPHSRLQIFPGAGHAPFLTRRTEFNACLSAFAREIYVTD